MIVYNFNKVFANPEDKKNKFFMIYFDSFGLVDEKMVQLIVL